MSPGPSFASWRHVVAMAAGVILAYAVAALGAYGLLVWLAGA